MTVPGPTRLASAATSARPATLDPAGLVATTTRLPASAGIDLLAAAGADGVLWQREDQGLAGRGAALRIDLPGGLAERERVATVAALLAGIRREDEVRLPGTGPVAIGALPFAPGAPGSLVVPAVTVGVAGGEAWVTTVTAGDEGGRDGTGGDGAGGDGAGGDGTGGDGTGRDGSGRDGTGGDGTGRVGTGGDELFAAVVEAATSGRRPPSDPPEDFVLRSLRPHAEWRRLIADTVAAIRAGRLDKVVLARRVDVEANRLLSTSDILARLLVLYPSCMVFRVGGFIGASPELLLDRRGGRIRSHPLAGTVARSGDLLVDEALVAGLLASTKDRAEHGYVIAAVRQALEPVCTWLETPEPSVIGLRNVSHLATLITGQLAPPRDGEALPTALELAASLHPTPAVGGTPTEAATAYIEKVEGFDRGLYGGPVGWVDADGDGSWALGIRSALVEGTTAALFAGVGVVADSDPEAELVETQLKLQALLAAMVRP